MTTKTGRIAMLAAFVALAAVLFVVLRDDGGSGDSGTTTAATEAEAEQPTETMPAVAPPEVIRMRNGAPVGGVAELSYKTGDRVRIRVKLDEPQEDVHIHGYEIEELNPSGSVGFDFKADIEGIFELEAHGPDGDVVLAEIRVEPA